MTGYDSSRPAVDRHLWEIRPVRDAVAGVILFLLVAGLISIKGVLMPAIAGFFLAYIVEPAVKLLHVRLKIPRRLSVLVMLLAGIAAGALVAGWLLPLVVRQGYTLFVNAPEYLRNIMQQLATKLGIPGQEIFKNLQPEPMELLQFIGNVIGAASTAVFWVFLLPFFFFVFAWQYPAIIRNGECLIPRRHRHSILVVLRRIDGVFGGFFRGRLIICICMGFFLALGWFLAGVPYWFLLGMVTGLLGIAPYLSILGWIAAVVFKYLSVNSMPFAWIPIILWPSLVFITANIVEEWMITPWVQSRAVNLSPATVVIAVLIGGAVGGVGGLLFAIPVAGSLKIVIQEIALPRLRNTIG